MNTKKLLNNIIAILLIFVILSTLISVPTSLAVENFTVTINGTKNYDKANEVLTLSNQERQAVGASPLSLDKSLCDYAMLRAAEIAIYFSHTRPDGTSAIGPGHTSSGIFVNGENIAAGSPNAEGAMNQWMTSTDGHREAILNSTFNSIGIGSYTSSSGQTWWVQVFSQQNATEIATYTGTAQSTDTITVSPTTCPVTLSITGLNTSNSIDIGETISPTQVKITNNGWSLQQTPIQLSDVKWTSSDPAIFTVNANGTVKGISAGTATLTASLGDFSKTYTITVNPEESISLNKTSSTLWVGNTDTLSVSYIPEGSEQGTISWESSNPNVATVNSNGKITAVSKGTTTITATASKSGKTAKCEVTVNQPYTGMTLNTNSITLDKSKTANIEVTTIPTQADETASITFKSSNKDIATVDSNGTVTGVNAGTTQIIVTVKTNSTQQTFEAVCDITVQAHIESITIDNGDLTLYKGQTEALNVSFNPDDFVESKALEWTSDNTSVATVTQDDQGNTIVKAIAPGTANITAKTVNGITDTITVTVPTVKIDTLTLNKNKTSIEKGQNETLIATILPENTTEDTTITWESSKENIATVDQNGNITAIAPGTTTITASTLSGLTAKCEVTVTCALESISLSSKNENLIANGTKKTVQLTVSKNPTDADPSIDDVQWTSGNDDIATVDENGLVTAVAPGTVIITATLDGKTDTCSIIVDTELKSVTIENQAQTLELVRKQTGKLNVILNPENATIIPTATWKSNNEDIATVDENGVVTAIAPGTAIITVDYGNGIIASRNVEVTEILANSITINNKVESMLINDIIKLGATLTPADATDNINWTSSDESILKVDQEGNVTALKAGKATITVSTDSGLTDSIEIEVTEKHIDSIIVSVSDDSIIEGANTQVGVTFNPTNITDIIESTTYEVSNPSIATVDENGLVTGLKAGEVIVTVSVNAKQGDGTVKTIVSQVKLNIKEASESAGDTGNTAETGNTGSVGDTENNPSNNEEVENNKNVQNTSDVQKGEENNSKIAEVAESLTTSPHTGDMNIIALVSTMVVSLIGMIIVIKKK